MGISLCYAYMMQSTITTAHIMKESPSVTEWNGSIWRSLGQLRGQTGKSMQVFGGKLSKTNKQLSHLFTETAFRIVNTSVHQRMFSWILGWWACAACERDSPWRVEEWHWQVQFFAPLPHLLVPRAASLEIALPAGCGALPNSQSYRGANLSDSATASSPHCELWFWTCQHIFWLYTQVIRSPNFQPTFIPPHVPGYLTRYKRHGAQCHSFPLTFSYN